MATPASKVLSALRLDEWRAAMRSAGKTVVHCHGCFDIVHPGHIAHLQEARALGDVLIVSVSSDANVNKGFARPLIPDDLRAASLAALECVDAVFVNSTPTAVDLLARLQPDVFVKGKEYETSADPRFLAEQRAVTDAGGRVAFTSGDIVYSSTALITQLTATDPFEREKLARFRDRYGLTAAALSQLVRRFEGLRTVVVGDYLRDRYHFCDATGVASEGPMLTLRLLGQKDYDGGAAVIARHAAAMGARPALVTSLGTDDDSAGVRARLEAAGVEVRAVPNRKQLVTKHRYLVETQKVMKLDEGPVANLDSAGVETLAREVEAACTDAGRADAAVFADFGYGLLTPSAIDRVLPLARQNARVLTADVSGRRGSLTRFHNVDLLTPTEKELRECANDFGSGLGAVAWNLLHDTSARALLVTMGRQGALAFDRAPGEAQDGRLRSEHVPAMIKHALDPLGCGDAMLSAATLTLAAGGSLQAATLLGSLAAAVQATRLGNEPVTGEDLIAEIGGLAGEERVGVRLAS